jgi:hypothetical protein
MTFVWAGGGGALGAFVAFCVAGAPSVATGAPSARTVGLALTIWARPMTALEVMPAGGGAPPAEVETFGGPPPDGPGAPEEATTG